MAESTTGTIIKTMIVQPTEDIPKEVFLECHRLAYFMEAMKRTEDGDVIWNEELTLMYSEDMAEAEYLGLMNDWFTIGMELPVDWVTDHLIEEASDE